MRVQSGAKLCHDVSVSEAPISSAELGRRLDEAEHQALDLLDALPCGDAWIAAQQAEDAVLDQERLDAALVEAGEESSAVTAAVHTAEAALLRLVTEVAHELLDAVTDLAQTDLRGDLDLTAPDEARELLNARRDSAAAIAPAVETTGSFLGLDRSSIAWAVLTNLGQRADAAAPARLQALSRAISERLELAHAPRSDPFADPRPLRVFRLAAARSAGPSIRARLLAAEHPEHLALAHQLVAEHRDPGALVDAFEAAASAQAQDELEPSETIDGPKRKFTWVHMILALIVLGLTLWHYVWR